MQRTSYFTHALRLGAVFSIAVCAGCYAYQPVPAGGARPGGEVQLTLTDSGSVILASAVGPSVIGVDGRLVTDSADAYLLNVTRTERRDGQETEWRGERVVVPRVLVSGITIRRFSSGRTILFSGLATGALVAIAEAFAGNGGATTAGRTPIGPPGGK